MNVLLKSATVVDVQSEFHLKTVDILIENGTISDIQNHIENPNNYQEINLPNLHVSKGWFDSSVSFGEPGYEERETLSHGFEVAAKSGFTTITVNPNTNPVVDSQADIQFTLSKAKDSSISAHPIGALTKSSKGIDLAELYDMQQSGAVAFNDYKKAIHNPNLLKIALQYVQSFDGLICSFPQNNDIAGKGVMNENETSTSLGLKGIPALAEELQIARDLFVLEYTGGKLHIPTISTKASVHLIREAKKKGLDVSCSVAIHNLIFTDETLSEFDTNYKVVPPLRTKEDIKALIDGLNDDTIDMVTSDHCPIDIEFKKIEFDHAQYGTIGLETAFSALLNHFSLEKTIDLLTQGRERFKIKNPKIELNAAAELSLFTPTGNYTFNHDKILSTSKNSAFLGTEIKGKVYGSINKGKITLA